MVYCNRGVSLQKLQKFAMNPRSRFCHFVCNRNSWNDVSSFIYPYLRNLMAISSVIVSWSACEFQDYVAKVHFRVMMAKDALIAIIIVGMVILYYIGLDNSCWCWSAVYSLGRENGFVSLDVIAQRTQK